MTDQPKPIDLVERYIYLRDKRKAADEDFAAWRKVHFDLPMQNIERTMLDMFEELGTDSIRTRRGTASRKINSSVTCNDNDAFRKYIIENAAWEIADWKPNKTAVVDIVNEGGDLPPGVSHRTFMSLNVQRPKEV